MARPMYQKGLLLAVALLPTVVLPGSAAAAGALSAKAQRQIAALQDAKRARDATERKVAGRLLTTVRLRRDGAARRALPKLTTGVEVSRAGRAMVDLEATVTARLLRRLRAAGATVHDASPRA